MSTRFLALALFGLMGLAMAVGPATTWTQTTTWGPYDNGGATASETVTGGMIYGGNLDATSTTTRWAGIVGEFTAGSAIVLADSDGTAEFHTWAWDPSDGGVVCLSTSAGPAWDGLADGVVATADSDWNFNTAYTDSITSTMAGACAALEIAGYDATGAPAVTPAGADISGEQNTCLLMDNSAAPKDQFLFCTPVVDGTIVYDTVTAGDFAALVPTPENGVDTETYYFYVELQ
ncbi:MAG: hypothetical protein QW035_01735 [Candidatus Anstonellales archaeon]